MTLSTQRTHMNLRPKPKSGCCFKDKGYSSYEEYQNDCSYKKQAAVLHENRNQETTNKGKKTVMGTNVCCSSPITTTVAARNGIS